MRCSMEKSDKKQNCENCLYFIPHFIIFGSTFLPAHCGRCKHDNFKRDGRRNFPYYDGCKLWRPNDEKKAKRQDDINLQLNYIEEHLNQIKQILQYDRQI